MALTQHPPARRRQIAEALGIDEQYVYQISTGRKTASPALARRWNEIEPSDSLQDLRPDDWSVIWPELISFPTESPGQPPAGQEVGHG